MTATACAARVCRFVLLTDPRLPGIDGRRTGTQIGEFAAAGISGAAAAALLSGLLLAGCECGSVVDPGLDAGGDRTDAGTDAAEPRDASHDGGDASQEGEGLDCGVPVSTPDERLACGADLCDVPAEACCAQRGTACSACVDRDSPPTACTAIFECWGHPGQCEAGSWCCERSGSLRTECIADPAECVHLRCIPGLAGTCPPERPRCAMLSLEGGFECVPGEPDMPDGG